MVLNKKAIQTWVKGKDREILVHIIRDCRERIESNPDHKEYVKGQKMIIDVVVAEWNSRQNKKVKIL